MKYKITLSKNQENILNIIKKNKFVIFFEDTFVVWVKDTDEFIDVNTFFSFVYMDLLSYNRKIGRDQYQYKLNRNVVNKIINKSS